VHTPAVNGRAAGAIALLTLFLAVVAASQHWPWMTSHWSELLDVAGTLATVAAAVMAWIALRAIGRERRTDFYLEQLVAIADLVGRSRGGSASESIAARLGLLPRGTLPTAEMWTGPRESQHSTSAYARYLHDRELVEGGMGWTEWVLPQILIEVEAATKKLVEGR